MTLHLCLDCATIYERADYHELRCPRCDGPLELREQLRDKTATFAELASQAVHGPAPRVRRLWSVG